MCSRLHAWHGACVARVACMAGACVVGGVCSRPHAWQGGMHGNWGHVWWGACVSGEMATAADGMHPTEMHSCLLDFPNQLPSNMFDMERHSYHPATKCRKVISLNISMCGHLGTPPSVQARSNPPPPRAPGPVQTCSLENAIAPAPTHMVPLRAHLPAPSCKQTEPKQDVGLRLKGLLVWNTLGQDSKKAYFET